MVRINGLFHLLINGVNWGYNPLILTIDPITSNGTSGCDISSDSNRFVFGGGNPGADGTATIWKQSGEAAWREKINLVKLIIATSHDLTPKR